MKTPSRFLLGLLVVCLILVILVHPILSVLAQDDESAWGEFLNPDGSINWANLTYLGEASEPADWMSIDLPGGIQVPLGDAVYNRYLTPNGNVLVLPSPVTLFMTFLNPEQSGFAANMPEMLGSGHSVLAMLAADYVDVADLQALGYIDPAEFFRAVIEGRENIWSVVSPNFLIELTRMTLDAGYLVTALWLYLNGGDCTAIPGGCPPGFGLPPTPGDSGGDPTPQPAACPAPSISFSDVSATGGQTEPLKPVVVGQDPERRGADVEVRIAIPPVIFTWYEARQTRSCEYVTSGTGSGCPGPGNRYDRVIGANGDRTSWNSSMENNSNWDVDTETECIEHVEVFPDYLDFASLSINLSGESRNWILTDLAQTYPGAHLKRPDWNFAFQGPGSLGGADVVSFFQLIPNIQFADPGVYTLRLNGRTTGTLVSSPRPFDLPLNPFQVDLLRVTLIEAP